MRTLRTRSKNPSQFLEPAFQKRDPFFHPPLVIDAAGAHPAVLELLDHGKIHVFAGQRLAGKLIVFFFYPLFQLMGRHTIHFLRAFFEIIPEIRIASESPLFRFFFKNDGQFHHDLPFSCVRSGAPLYRCFVRRIRKEKRRAVTRRFLHHIRLPGRTF